MKRAIINCNMVDIQAGVIQDNTTILWENNMIKAVGQQIDLPSDVDVIDGAQCFVTPGLINAFTHLGLEEIGVRWEGSDGFESSEIMQPDLSVIDGIYPFDKGFEYARSAGVTTVHVSPGPENIVAGLTAIIKTNGTIIDEMIVEEQHGLSVSLGELPKLSSFRKHKRSITRMGIASIIRSQLRKALYNVEDDEKHSEIYNKVLDKEIPLYIRAHRMDDIVTAIRLKEEFDIDVILVHGTEAVKVAPILKNSHIPVLAGPFYSSKSRPELESLHPSSVAKLHKAELDYTITTPIVRNLSLEGALANREGLSHKDALYALTLGAANILRISDQVGSIEKGKHADIVVWSGDPLELKTYVKQTICNGRTVYLKEGVHK